MKQFNGFVGIYQDKATGKMYLGTPYISGNQPRYAEYDCVAYRFIGTAKISLNLETEKEVEFYF